MEYSRLVTVVKSAEKATLTMNKSTFLYTAYGLVIQSELELPELDVCEGASPDVTIKSARLSRALPSPELGAAFVYGDRVQQLDWAVVGKFDIRGCSEIRVDANPGVPPEIVRLPLLGPVLAFLLHLRGFLVLHASAVLVGEAGVGFMGDKMAGKSTTAGAMVSDGCPLLTDDVMAISFADQPLVAPGFPQMKLSDKSSAAVALTQAQRSQIDFPGFEKQPHLIRKQFHRSPVPPRRLYVLQRGETPKVEALTVPEAFQAITRFSYLIRYGSEALTGAAAARFMQQSAELAKSGIVKRLTIPDDLDRLEEAVQTIRADSNGG